MDAAKPIPKIAELRGKVKLTQFELSQKVGVTETTIANWEKGRSGIEWIERVIRLCDALQCAPRDLISSPVESLSLSEVHELVGVADQSEKPSTHQQDTHQTTMDISVDEQQVRLQK